MDMNWSDGSEMRGRDIRDELSSPESEEEDQLDGTGSSSNELYSTMTIKQECIEDVSFEMCAGESDDSNHFSDAEMNESEEQAATELSRDMEVTSTVPEYDLHSMNIWNVQNHNFKLFFITEIKLIIHQPNEHAAQLTFKC